MAVPSESGTVRHVSDTHPGHYEVKCTARWRLNSSNRREVMPVWHIGETTEDGPSNSNAAASIAAMTTAITDIHYLDEGDGVSMTVLQTSGASLNLIGAASGIATVIRITRVGP